MADKSNNERFFESFFNSINKGTLADLHVKLGAILKTALPAKRKLHRTLTTNILIIARTICNVLLCEVKVNKEQKWFLYLLNSKQ